jgi:short-subunit dehydrogenase involved in D-alanine esterification of teichoic acids
MHKETLWDVCQGIKSQLLVAHRVTEVHSVTFAHIVAFTLASTEQYSGLCNRPNGNNPQYCATVACNMHSLRQK